MTVLHKSSLKEDLEVPLALSDLSGDKNIFATGQNVKLYRLIEYKD